VLHRIAFPVVSEWYQNCPSFGLYGRGPEESKIRTVASLSPMQVLNIEEQARVPQNLNPWVCQDERLP
jgi:hypothetical protein